MNKRQWLAGIASAAVLVLTSGCAGMHTGATAGKGSTIADVTAKTANLSTVNRLIQTAGLVGLLSGHEAYTLFAPSDDAFKNVPATTMAELAAHPEQLKALLSHHVVAGKLSSSALGNQPLKALDGNPIAPAQAGSFVTVDDALVTTPDLNASNGVIHVIDKVLMPPKKK